METTAPGTEKGAATIGAQTMAELHSSKDNAEPRDSRTNSARSIRPTRTTSVNGEERLPSQHRKALFVEHKYAKRMHFQDGSCACGRYTLDEPTRVDCVWRCFCFDGWCEVGSVSWPLEHETIDKGSDQLCGERERFDSSEGLDVDELG